MLLLPAFEIDYFAAFLPLLFRECLNDYSSKAGFRIYIRSFLLSNV